MVHATLRYILAMDAQPDTATYLVNEGCKAWDDARPVSFFVLYGNPSFFCCLCPRHGRMVLEVKEE